MMMVMIMMMIVCTGSGENINPGLPWYGVHQCGASKNGFWLFFKSESNYQNTHVVLHFVRHKKVQSTLILAVILNNHHYQEGGDVDSEDKLVNVDVFGDLCKGLDLGDKVALTPKPRLSSINQKQVSEWVSEVILGDAQGGMRILYHSSGESTRWLKH